MADKFVIYLKYIAISKNFSSALSLYLIILWSYMRFTVIRLHVIVTYNWFRLIIVLLSGKITQFCDISYFMIRR
jgi:hypothetical protein